MLRLVGPDGAGHYTKMVYNGIEYGDMQVIAEADHLMRMSLSMAYPEMEVVSGGGVTGCSTPA